LRWQALPRAIDQAVAQLPEPHVERLDRAGHCLRIRVIGNTQDGVALRCGWNAVRTAHGGVGREQLGDGGGRGIAGSAQPLLESGELALDRDVADLRGPDVGGRVHSRIDRDQRGVGALAGASGGGRAKGDCHQRSSEGSKCLLEENTGLPL
jgi:hypothetical protein